MIMMMNKAHFSGIGFAVIFGFSFMFSKTALSFMTPFGLLAYRFLSALIAMECLRRLKLFSVRFERQHIRYIAAVAVLQPVLYFLFETYGLSMTTSGEAGMMIALIPIFATLFGAWLLKEKPTLVQLGFIVLSVSGIIFIQLSQQTVFSSKTFGFVLLLGAVLAAALFNIASRSASKTLYPHELTYYMMLVGAVVFNILYGIQLLSEQRILDYVLVFTEVNAMISVLYLSIVSSIIGFFLVNYSLKHLEAHVISIYANIATIVAIAAGAVFLKETLYLYHYIGSAMIIIGVYGTVSMNRRHAKRYPPTLQIPGKDA